MRSFRKAGISPFLARLGVLDGTPAIAVAFFGALTLAGDGGRDLPAGATSITDAGVTGLTVTGGKIVPAANGVAAGLVTFDNGALLNVQTVADAYSVADHDQFIDVLERSDLTPGTTQIMLREGIYNDDSLVAQRRVGRTSPWNSAPGVVRVTGHSNEAVPIYRSLFFDSNSGRESVHPIEFSGINFQGRLWPSNDVETRLRSHFSCAGPIIGLQFDNCQFGTPISTENQRINVFDCLIGHTTCRNWKVTNCTFTDVGRAFRTLPGSEFRGNFITRWCGDVWQNCSEGCIIENNVVTSLRFRFVEHVPTSVAVSPLNPNHLRFQCANTIFIGATDPDYVVVARNFDGGLSVLNDRFLAMTYVDDNQFDIDVEESGLDLSGVTTMLFEGSGEHSDLIQTGGFGSAQAGDPSYDTGYDLIIRNNVFLRGTELSGWAGAVQGIFMDEQHDVRMLVTGNMVLVGGITGMSRDSGAIIAAGNTVLAGELGDAFPTRMTILNMDRPEECLVVDNVTHSLSIDSEITVSNNVEIPLTDLGTYFVNPIYGADLDGRSVVEAAYTPINGDAGAVGSRWAGGAVPVLAFNPTVTQGDPITDLSGNCMLIDVSHTVYMLLTNDLDAVFTPAQVEGAAVGGTVVGAGSATGTLTASVSFGTIPDGSYKLHLVVKDGSTYSDEVITKEILHITVPASGPAMTVVWESDEIVDTGSDPDIPFTVPAGRYLLGVTARSGANNAQGPGGIVVDGLPETPIIEGTSAGGPDTRSAAAFYVLDFAGPTTGVIDFDTVNLFYFKAIMYSMEDRTIVDQTASRTLVSGDVVPGDIMVAMTSSKNNNTIYEAPFVRDGFDPTPGGSHAWAYGQWEADEVASPKTFTTSGASDFDGEITVTVVARPNP